VSDTAGKAAAKLRGKAMSECGNERVSTISELAMTAAWHLSTLNCSQFRDEINEPGQKQTDIALSSLSFPATGAAIIISQFREK
jgi:hypothetical protein